ncbi:MAG: hypothetical protein UT50_C0001G0063 [Candidatus Moranbacteria bacterium GW2011_GWA2_39_41]|nr:MAG: hypothetical protein UT50_C0001G0063 [Candidatus Moranbacteria bacterium GW2011_GWA2_39_41]
MLDFIFNQVLFYLILAFVLFIPGYSLLLAIFGHSKTLSTLEKFAISFGLSIVGVDFIFFAFSKANIAITRLSSAIGIAAFILICLAIFKIRKFSNSTADEKLFSFSKNQFILILLLIFLSIFIKTAYLTDTVFPTATDMGHHMYWAKWMVENHQLPTYDGMPDFIIGEHIIFATVATLSGASFFSAFPIAILFLVNLLSILMVSILTLRIFKEKNIAILSLLFLGVLYAVSSPQAKFVSGGVVGNILGNLLLPMSFYFYYRAFSFFETDEKVSGQSKTFLALAFFSTFGLLYTHHLTVFIFLFILTLIVAIFLVLNIKNLKNIFTSLFKIIFSPQVLATLAICLIFFFWVFTPNYIKGGAVDTAVGAPSKETRAGLTIANLRSSIGEARIALGFLGLLVLAIGFKRKNFGYTIVAAWAIMIFTMSTQPNLLLVNLPSSRIGNYLSYPFAILSAYTFYFVFKNKANQFLKVSFIVIATFVLVDGISDSAYSFKNKEDLSPLAQTFNASTYLANHTTTTDEILKDHNYITADSWMKIILMRGYKYPQSRGFFKRYDDATKPREMCTLHMISTPDSPEAKLCFADTNTNFIAINPNFDSAQFLKLKNFDQVYSSTGINIYYKNN